MPGSSPSRVVSLFIILNTIQYGYNIFYFTYARLCACLSARYYYYYYYSAPVPVDFLTRRHLQTNVQFTIRNINHPGIEGHSNEKRCKKRNTNINNHDKCESPPPPPAGDVVLLLSETCVNRVIVRARPRVSNRFPWPFRSNAFVAAAVICMRIFTGEARKYLFGNMADRFFSLRVFIRSMFFKYLYYWRFFFFYVCTR